MHFFCGAEGEFHDQRAQRNSYSDLRGVTLIKGNGRIFDKGRFLGKGGFARCYEVEDRATGEKYAAKIIAKNLLSNPATNRKFRQEVDIHKSVEHDRIVKFYDSFEDRKYIYMILELCPNHSLHNLLNRRDGKGFPEKDARRYVYDLVLALVYLHRQRIVHRDLKVGNMMLDAQHRVKLGDFGLAARMEGKCKKRHSFCGTPNYIAPEILESAKGHSFEADVWSVGIVMYTLLFGRPPFEGADASSTYKNIRNLRYSFPALADVSPAAVHLIRRLLVPDPSKRPRLEDVLDSSWFLGLHDGTAVPAVPIASNPLGGLHLRVPAPRLPDDEHADDYGLFSPPRVHTSEEPELLMPKLVEAMYEMSPVRPSGTSSARARSTPKRMGSFGDENEDPRLSGPVEPRPHFMGKPALTPKRMPLAEVSDNIQVQTEEFAELGHCSLIACPQRGLRPRANVVPLGASAARPRKSPSSQQPTAFSISAACGSGQHGFRSEWLGGLFAPASGQGILKLLMPEDSESDEGDAASADADDHAIAGGGQGEAAARAFDVITVSGSYPAASGNLGSRELATRGTSGPNLHVTAYPAASGRKRQPGPPSPLPQAAHELGMSGGSMQGEGSRIARAASVLQTPTRLSRASHGCSPVRRLGRAPLSELLWCDDCHCNSCNTAR
eukprot:TRINITY_DN34884_c0_g2_i1.p1 TRINITY_DN34884_c0_g2~~TRINITY_DN34884_c0_g2_i1.p1  ORF type:complete len:667 (-),score=117.88 TRINITY_DN34884_c0_g2_i1:78-2078(-)